MDDRQGNFDQIDTKKFEEQMQKPFPMVFQEGEIIPVYDVRLRVERIERKKLVMKLLDPFKDGDPKPLPGEVFSLGEILQIRGSKFKVDEFKSGNQKKIMVLKLLPQPE